MFDIDFLNALVPQLRAVAREAGDTILRYYDQADPIDARRKGDGSPVTDADIAADDLIVAALKRITPDIPVISEERYDGTSGLPETGTCWLVDPLDGTKDFINRTGDFTVNIGLLENLRPVAGILHAPVHRETFWGFAQGGAWAEKAGMVNPIQARQIPATGYTVVSSRFYKDDKRLAELMKPLIVERHSVRGSAYKFCEVADGRADFSPYLGISFEWDSAAGHAIILGAGGRVEVSPGQPLEYGKPGLKNTPFQIWGRG